MTDRDRPDRTALVELSSASSAAATLRAYKTDWMHYAAWCDEREFVVIPAAPPIVGACLGSLANSHAPSTIGRD